MSTKTDKELLKEEIVIKESVRKAYAEFAIKNSLGESCGIESSCCGTPKGVDLPYSKTLGYTDQDLEGMVDGANMGLGCGNPTAIAELKCGETVIDLGSGGGFDCFLAARQVGPTGHIIGVDMTPEMISKARLNPAKGGHLLNVEFRLGEIEHLPVANNIAHVVISNCVLNLSTNKAQVLREASRVLKVGGRLAISDVVATSPLPQEIKNDLELYKGCMAGAVPLKELEESLRDAGFRDISIVVNKASRNYIEGWSHSQSGVQNFVASAPIRAIKS